MAEAKPWMTDGPSMESVPPRILLGPGPSMVNPRVLQAMMQNMIGYLDPDYVLIMEEVSELLKDGVPDRRRDDLGAVRHRIVRDGGGAVQHTGAGGYGGHLHLRVLRRADGGHGDACRRQCRHAALRMGPSLPGRDARKDAERALLSQARRLRYTRRRPQVSGSRWRASHSSHAPTTRCSWWTRSRR